MSSIDHRRYWDDGFTFEAYLEEVEENEDLWSGVYRKHDTPAWALERLEEIGGDWHLIAITEDWCGDASNTVPVVARLAEDSPRVDLRVVKRDENTDLMDQYLTDGSRSIPIIVILDGDFEPVDHWGPRPEELQEFVISEKEKGERPVDEIYRDTRKWYARDRGETTLRELLAKIESTAAVEA